MTSLLPVVTAFTARLLPLVAKCRSRTAPVSGINFLPLFSQAQ